MQLEIQIIEKEKGQRAKKILTFTVPSKLIFLGKVNVITGIYSAIMSSVKRMDKTVDEQVTKHLVEEEMKGVSDEAYNNL